MNIPVSGFYLKQKENSSTKLLCGIKGVDGIQFPSLEELSNDVAPYNKKKVIEYLNNGRVELAIPKVNIDVLTGERFGAGDYILTDGVFEWHSVLTYYVEKYNITLPQEFLRKIGI